MAETLMSMAEAGKYTRPFQAGVQVQIVEEEPLLDFIRWKQLPKGNSSYDWFDESDLPSAAFRAVGGGYTADTGIFLPKSEPLSILGGEMEIDNFITDTQGAKLPDFVSRHVEMKMRAARNAWLEEFFEGDVGIDTNGFDGLRVRATESTMDFDMSGTGSTDVAALTLATLDQVLDAVHGRNGDKIIASNQFLRRKVSALVRAAGQAREMVDRQNFGEQMLAYAGAPLIVIQKENDQSSILAFDEDPGDGGDDAASMYVIKFGDEEDVFGILGNGGAWEVRFLTDEQESNPRDLRRINVYVGLVTAHPRAFARINSIGQL
jgi:hypothetical protein